MSPSPSSADMQKLLKAAPRWERKEVPNLDHDEAYDFVKYSWPQILRYIRSLEADQKAMREALEFCKVTSSFVNADKFPRCMELIQTSSDQALSSLQVHE